MNNLIAPFKCTKCGGIFSEYWVILCAKCKKYFCFTHSFEHKVGSEKEYVCEQCSKEYPADEKFIPMDRNIWKGNWPKEVKAGRIIMGLGFVYLIGLAMLFVYIFINGGYQEMYVNRNGGVLFWLAGPFLMVSMEVAFAWLSKKLGFYQDDANISQSKICIMGILYGVTVAMALVVMVLSTYWLFLKWL